MKTERKSGRGQENLSAKHILGLAGLTYRQLHDWEERAGIIESERAAEEGWRKFNWEEAFALAVCARIRERFSLPLSKIGPIYKWLIGRTHDPFLEELAELSERRMESYRNDPTISAILDGKVFPWLKEAVRKDAGWQFLMRKIVDTLINIHSRKPIVSAHTMAQFGMPSYLLIDDQRIVLLSESNVVGWFSERRVDKPVLIFPLLSLFNEIHANMNIPEFTLDHMTTSFQDYWKRLELRTELSKSEREVLRLIRERDYQRVVAHVKDGRVIRVERESEVTPSKEIKLEEQILAAINEGDYQDVKIHKRGGRVVHISRAESIKLD